MKHLPESTIWFICGSQHLYGPGPLQEVAANAADIATALSNAPAMPFPLTFKGVVTRPEEIRSICIEANSDPDCAGVVLWMHTFSPARMWIGGLSLLNKPFCHLHTQFNRDLPWSQIDMDFMNLNQAAHGDREAGYLHSRMRLARKVVVGHWSDPEVHDRLGAWARVVRAWHDLQGAPFARFGDNMRNVAVTEGDKVGAELRFGFSFNGFGVGDLVEHVNAATVANIDSLVQEYEDLYDVASELRRGGDRHDSLRYGAAIELGLRSFLDEDRYRGFTTNFEDLHGLRQLPGLAVQRLMADGYGFGGEGDWKTAAMVRVLKVIAHGTGHGTSFMEDYTYHLDPAQPLVLGAHMLEVCPSIAEAKPRIEIHPLSIGDREDPVRMVFDAQPGSAITACMVDMGNRFRLVATEIETVSAPTMPKLPVGRAVWKTKAEFKTAAHAWILAGGSHHTAYSTGVTTEHLTDFSEIAGAELIVISATTEIADLKRELRLNEVHYTLVDGLRS